MTDTQNPQKQPDNTPNHNDLDRYIQILDRMEGYLLAQYNKNSGDGYRNTDFDPSTPSGTKRTHVRITDELKEWAENQPKDKLFKSREMLFGTCVSFAAANSDEFVRYAFEQAYKADAQELGIDISSDNKTNSNEDNSEPSEDSSETTENSTPEDTKETNEDTSLEQEEPFYDPRDNNDGPKTEF